MGGAQRYIYEIVKLLGDEYELLVAAGEGDGELFKKLGNTQVAPVYLKQMKRTPWPWQITSAIWEIRNLLKKEEPDVLFLCSTTAGLLGSVAARIYRGPTSPKIKGEVGPRVVYRIGGWAFRDPRPFWKNWLILLAEKITAPLKDLIIVNSEIDRKLALKYKIVSEKKLVKIYNGIDVNSLNFLSREEARKRLLTSDFNKPLVGCVANFYKTKGLEYLIEAFRYLLQSNCHHCNDGSSTAITVIGAAQQVNAQFVIIGDGQERPKLENLIKKYNLEDKVVLAGRIPDAYQYLKAFDVFVLPSLKEGFPWIILEAIAAQVPIVATNVGALPEILNEESLVSPRNTEALAKKISWMLEHPVISQFKPEFTLSKMVSETEKILFP